MLLLLDVYRWFISHSIKRHCSFQLKCSEYTQKIDRYFHHGTNAQQHTRAYTAHRQHQFLTFINNVIFVFISLLLLFIFCSQLQNLTSLFSTEKKQPFYCSYLNVPFQYIWREIKSIFFVVVKMIFSASILRIYC
jgi:hypothetical protein